MTTQPWQEDLVAALRGELQEYGGLIALIDEQQAAILRGDPDTFLTLGAAVNEQVVVVGVQRARREDFVRSAARTFHRPAGSPLSEFLADFPVGVAGMLRALIDEVNALITRTQRRLRQNQLLLARCVSAAEATLSRASASAVTSTYSNNGYLNRRCPESYSRMAVA